jgi:hypothetical protein
MACSSLASPFLSLILKSAQQQACGVTVCDGNIYIIEGASNCVIVFSADEPYEEKIKEKITVDKMIPRDIASLEDKKYLFIADPFAPCVWRLTTDNSQRERLIRSVKARSFFMDSSLKQLLVTTYGDIYVYDVDGNQKQHIVVHAR